MTTAPVLSDPLVAAIQTAMDALTVMLPADLMVDRAQARAIVREELMAHLTGHKVKGARTAYLAREELSDRAVMADIVARCAARLLGKEDLLS